MRTLVVLSMLMMACRTEPLPGPESTGIAVACVEEGRQCLDSASCCSGYCDITAYTYGNCRARLKEGQECVDDPQCAAGLFCDNEGYAYWQCTKALPAGGYCSAHKQCTSGKCGADSRCAR